jgi:hypothetical protein
MIDNLVSAGRATGGIANRFAGTVDDPKAQYLSLASRCDKERTAQGNY